MNFGACNNSGLPPWTQLGGVSPRASPAQRLPGVSVTPGNTVAASARGNLITVKPEGGPTPYRARATVHIAREREAHTNIEETHAAETAKEEDGQRLRLPGQSTTLGDRSTRPVQ